MFVSVRDLGFEVNGVVFIWLRPSRGAFCIQPIDLALENDAKWNYLPFFTRQMDKLVDQ